VKGILLDTHAFLWFATGDEALSIVARDAITTTSDVFVSAASAWEVRTKYRLGRLSSAAVLAHDLRAAVERLELTELPIDFADGDLAGALAGTHRDPFDRMLIAQSLNHELSLVSNETVFDDFGVTRIW
jgi:PIN domain nuclease of toxin-antitoxin system